MSRNGASDNGVARQGKETPLPGKQVADAVVQPKAVLITSDKRDESKSSADGAVHEAKSPESRVVSKKGAAVHGHSPSYKAQVHALSAPFRTVTCIYSLLPILQWTDPGMEFWECCKRWRSLSSVLRGWTRVSCTGSVYLVLLAKTFRMFGCKHFAFPTGYERLLGGMLRRLGACPTITAGVCTILAKLPQSDDCVMQAVPKVAPPGPPLSTETPQATRKVRRMALHQGLA